MEISNQNLSHDDFKIISWDNVILKSKMFDFKIMLSHEMALKSKDTKKCMMQLLSFNKKIIQTSVSKKLYRK